MERNILQEFEMEIMIILNNRFGSIQRIFKTESEPLQSVTVEKPAKERVYIAFPEYQPPFEFPTIIREEI